MTRVAAALRTEVGLARLALSVVGLHVVDDDFLQPSPWRPWPVHLVSGLVPLALIIGAGVLYPRVRPGVRAAIALLAGFLVSFRDGGRSLHKAGRPVRRRLHRAAVDRGGPCPDRPRRCDAVEVSADGRPPLVAVPPTADLVPPRARFK